MDQVGKFGSWADLYVMLGTSSAALLGLLFVATSLHLRDLVENVSYATRARYNNYVLLLTLAEAAFILMPQPVEALSVELSIANLVMLIITAKVIYRFILRSRELGKRGGFSIYRSATFLAVSVAGTIGGVFLNWDLHIGIYVVTAAYIAALITVALNAWAIMLGVGEAESNASERKHSR